MIEIVSKDDTRIQFDDREAKYSNVLKRYINLSLCKI